MVMEKLKRFFWQCSGAHIGLLEKCPVESSKYAGIGATVFFTGIFAAIAASYALYTVFDNPWTAALFGLLWGLMIFNLDRYIVSSMRKEGSTLKEIRMATPRLILAILISMVIAKPLEMKIFEKELQAELLIMEQQTISLQEGEIRSRFSAEQEKLKSEVDALKKEIAGKTASRDELMRIAQAEADGTGGTMQRNAGPIYKIKKADADRVDAELRDLTAKNDLVVRNKLRQIAENDSIVAAETGALVRQKLDGPAARMEALDRLTAKSDAIWWTNIFIVLLFIAIETAPVFVKLISSKGPYDHLLKVEEHGFETRRIEELGQVNAAVKGRAETLLATEKDFIQNRLDGLLNQS